MPRTVFGVFRFLLRHPFWLVRQWNWKAAVLSSASRGTLFFVTNLHGGLEAAASALLTEFALRGTTAGFYGAATQAFRGVEPARRGTIAVSILLPVLSHTIELITHWMRGTHNLAFSIVASAAFTIVSTQFNLFAMRRDALIVGTGSRSLFDDLSRVPALLVSFVWSAVPRRS